MRKKTEMKRKAILKVAHEVFCERGYEKTSMNEIAARLGGSKTTLYGYFSSKKLLFQEVMSAAANRNRDEIATYIDQSVEVIPAGYRHRIEAVFSEVENSPMDIAAILKNFGEKFMSMICLPEFQELYRLAVEESGRSKTGSVFYEVGPLTGRKRIAAFLEVFMKRGQLRQADTDVAAAQLFALLRAELFERYLFRYGEPFDAAEFRQKIEVAIDAFLKIYRPDGQ